MKYFIISLLCLISTFPFSADAASRAKVNKTASMKENNFDKPDFNFPKTVIKNAKPELDAALAKGDQERAFKALLEICSAESLISTDNTDRNLALIDSVSNSFDGGWKALAYMLQATIVCDVYRGDPWTYDSRNLPAVNRPDEIELWDGKMFRLEVRELINKAIAVKTPDTMLAKFGAVLRPSPDNSFLLDDFLYRKSIELLRSFNDFSADVNPIPFFVIGTESYVPSQALEKADGFIESLCKRWRSTFTPETDPGRWALLIETETQNMRITEKAGRLMAYYFELRDYGIEALTLRFIGSPYLSESVMEDQMIPAKVKEFYDPYHIFDLLRNYKLDSAKLNPKINKLVSGSVTNYINEWKRISVDVSVPQKMLPGRATDILLTDRNLSKGVLTIYRVPETTPVTEWFIEKMSQLRRCVKVDAIQFGSDKPVPFVDTLKIQLPALTPGRYVLALSENGSLENLITGYTNKDIVKLRIFTVTDLASFTLDSFYKNDEVFLVNASDCGPVAGADIKIKSRYKDTYKANVRSDADGCIKLTAVPESIDGIRLETDIDGNLWSQEIYGINPRGKREQPSVLEAKILFDRSISRPGDEIGFAAILYTRKNTDLELRPSVTAKFILRNASGIAVDSVSLLSDRFARCEGKIRIPEDGMLGIWTLEAEGTGRTRWDRSSAGIRIEEYKNPTTRLILDKVERQDNDTIVLAGLVSTYSGMPVPDSKVSLKIETYSPWWRLNPADGSFSTETTTDSDGRFRIVLSTKNIKGTVFAEASYILSGVAVSTGGDVAEDRINFSLGTKPTIVSDIPLNIEVKDNILRLNVRVLDPAGNPEQRAVRYKITGMSDHSVSLEGIFTSPLLEIPAAKLPSGTYTPVFWLNDDESVKTEAGEIIIWHRDDHIVPTKNSLWIPETRIIAEEGKSDVTVRFGSAYKGQRILCIVSDSKTELSRRWIESDGFMNSINVPVPTDSSRIFVSLTTVRDFNPDNKVITVLPSSESRPLTVKIQTFRDKLMSDTAEKWSFRFTNGLEIPARNIPALAVMTDRALDSLVPFSWKFAPRQSLQWYPAVSVNVTYPYNFAENFYRNSGIVRESSVLSGFPTEWLYYPFITNYRIRSYRKYASANSMGYGGEEVMRDEAILESVSVCEDTVMNQVKSATTLSESVVYDSEQEPMLCGSVSEESLEGSTAGTTDESLSAKETYRESECPVAFFMPNLTTDEDGTVSVEFNVPDYNTSWKFQLLGYDKRLDAASITLEAISTKPVMIQASLPRFVRTGDKVILTARAFNNSESDLKLGGKIEIIDPENGKVIESRYFAGENTRPSGRRSFQLELNVPSTLDAVIVRSLAEADGHSDGEQSVLPILPSSSPVIESTPFYLAPGEHEFSIDIPELNKKSLVTLMYCDNPAWYCLTALPALVEERGTTLTSLLYGYYGNAIASGLLSSRPELRKGLEEMNLLQSEGKTEILTSNLERNADLKTVKLGSTPWINSASAETARMGSLVELLDSAKTTSTLDKFLSDISALRNSDGGMKWFPGDRESSTWCTGRTLLHFAMLDRFGYLPINEQTREIVKGGFEYTRKNILKDWNEYKKRHGDSDETLGSLLSLFTNYLYITSQYRTEGLVPKETGEFAKLAKRSLKLIGERWGEMSVYDKATAATLLFNRGEKETARRILRSLSELAISDDRRGMWYDNLNGGFGGMFSPWNKLITTAQVLEAYTDIEPEAPEVDKLRQWLLLQRQAENWGEMNDAAELVQAILGSGTNWTSESSRKPSFRITAGSKVLLESKDIPAYGETVVSLKPSDISGKTLRISRNAADADGTISDPRKPTDMAWGGLIEQYVAPMSEIKAASIPELSIGKSVFALNMDADGQENAELISGPLKIGDKVRILLTVDCGRDMEYVVINDERGACLEPTEALSRTDIIDGRFLYREVRNSETRLFLSYLPKGRYQFSYDYHVTSAGTFTAGIATIQSQYAPQLTSHSAAVPIVVK